MSRADKELYVYAATLLQYCPISGVFRWRWRDGDAPGNRMFNERGTPEYSARHNEALEIERQIAELRAKGDDRG